MLDLKNARDLSLPGCSAVTYGRRLRYMGTFIWSKLHFITIKLADSLNAFKNKIRVLDLSDVVSQCKCKDCYLCRN